MMATMKREFTATVYILNGEKVLLISHRKLGKWLPPGGHIDSNEMPHEAAVREAFEETGIEVELISQENVWIDQSNAISIPRPYMCLLEEIPEYKGHPAHQHVDFIFVGKVVGGSLNHNDAETGEARWFSLDELDRLKPEVDIFTETLLSIRSLFNNKVICDRT